jgi:NAD(P)-dependent dehydrogenase (short-subunit alcohol dehydrogenase family)
MRFEGRTAIVTGAGAGIGKATGLRLAQEGARVIATDLDRGRLAALAAEHPDLDLVIVTGDITNCATVEAVVGACDGRIDVLVNNAGIMDSFLPTAEVDDDTWARVMEVNVTAMMRLTRMALPFMMRAGGGSIVNVSSEAALRATTAGVAYTTSKHAVVGFTKSTAFMYSQHGIRCNAVAPGFVTTAIQAEFKSELAAARLQPLMAATMPEPVGPERLAAAIAWLASDDSLNVNGVLLPSDAGWSLI